MRIAQVAPLMESVPPKLYGGTERIVSYLTEELVHQGHEVTLFASGDSRTAANLHATVPAALRLNPGIKDPLAYTTSPFRSAMSMLNFEVNRAGRNLTPERKRELTNAKAELRTLFHRSSA